MRIAYFLAPVVASAASVTDFTSAEDIAQINIMTRPSNTKIIDADKKARRLKGRYQVAKEGEEERIIIAPVLAAHIVAHGSRVRREQASEVSEVLVSAARKEPESLKKVLTKLVEAGLMTAAALGIYWAIVYSLMRVG